MPGTTRGTNRAPRRTYTANIRRAMGKPKGGVSQRRFTVVRIVLVGVLGIAGLKLVEVQGFRAEALSARAEQQRTTSIEIPAQRGAIVDRNGAKLAFSVETRSLSVNLRLMRKHWEENAQKKPGSANFAARAVAAAKYIASKVPGRVTEQELLDSFHKQQDFTYLVHNVEPSTADDITSKQNFPEITAEKRAEREYPGGTLASNIVGVANWRLEDLDTSKHNLHGLAGLESVRDNDLAGTPGSRLVDTEQGNDNVVIPGTERELRPATAGSDLELTIDSDVQYDLQSRLADYVPKARAKSGSAVIMDVQTGQIYALANDRTFDPNDQSTFTPDLMSNRAISHAYEPGSVSKIVTATAAIEGGLATPESVMDVPGSLQVADHVVHDAWKHGTQTFTTTGIFAKSSNVGTLLLAQKVGQEHFAEMLKKFGLGQRTGVGLAGESPGFVPAREKWSGTTFGNLPIGQGLSMTVVQMAGMYQAIANNGLRVEPRIVQAKVSPDGTRVPEPAPKTTQVVSPQTAETVKDMMRAVTQKDNRGQNSGTAPVAALEGYQITGKTGTGQQVDPKTGAYSDTLYNITFAGVLPADNPRFVIAIRLDAPDTTLPAGSSAAPLFHDIASYLAQRYQIPLSNQPSPIVPLIL